MGQIAARLASFALQDSNKDILRSLETDNNVLNDIHEESIKIILERKIAVHSFQEAKGMTGIKGVSGKIVDNFSSKLDLPKIETVESIDADHRQMARCSCREDETYRKIAGELKSRIKKGVFDPIQDIQQALILESSQQVVYERQAASEIRIHKRYIQMPFVPNKRFVGREEALKELERRLLIDRDAQRLAIVGLGGTGKTQLARAFCYIMKERYPDFSILWVSAISSATFKQDFRSIAKAYSLTAESEEEQLSAVRDYLSSTACRKWLLVVDNADDTNLLRDQENGIMNYLPQSENGLTLFTTRYKDLADLADYNIVDLQEMSIHEATLFLEKFFQREYLVQNQALVKEFLEELAYLPLAIVQASAYIIKNSTTISKYLALIKTTEKEMISLLSQDFHDNTRSKESHNAVAVTWLVSFDQIKKDEPTAADLLFFLAFLENKAIPLTILPASKLSSELTRAVGVLVGYSFLSKQGEGDEEVYDMHRLVHRAIKTWMQRENLLEEWKQKIVSHLVKIFPHPGWENRNLWQLYVPHTIRVLQNTEQTDQRAELCLILGDCLSQDGRFSESIIWVSECVSWRLQTLPEDDHKLLIAQSKLATAYLSSGKVPEAIEKGLAINLKPREDDFVGQSIRHTLAVACMCNGQAAESIEMIEEITAVGAELSVDSTPFQLILQHFLAQAYMSNGRQKEAIGILEKVVAIEARMLPEDVYYQLIAQHRLANAYASDNQIDKAIGLMQHVVDIQQKFLRDEHPFRVISETELSVMQAMKAHDDRRKAEE